MYPSPDAHRIAPGHKVDLAKIDTRPGDKADKEATIAKTAERLATLNELQTRLYAEGKQKVLVVLQAIDAGGKDGTIRDIFGSLNPAGVRIASFKQPSAVELAHDYLWRIHQQTPATGEIAVFNRSHYEDVLIVRVHELVEPARWKRRYDHIVNFEQMLADEGTTIVKLFLHISKEEQRERLQDRVDNPKKQWKFASGDLAERARWDEYQDAFEDMLSRTSTEAAPWHVIPADQNWYRNAAITSILGDTLERLNPQFPPPEEGVAGTVVV
jgi:PPK2 family polyphosphate:nucleotide phosphotransferase